MNKTSSGAGRATDGSLVEAKCTELLPTNGKPAFKLSQLHGSRIAIKLNGHEGTRIVQGRGAYESDLVLGPILRVQLGADESDCEILFAERAWTGLIECGATFGCDYSIRLDSATL